MGFSEKRGKYTKKGEAAEEEEEEGEKREQTGSFSALLGFSWSKTRMKRPGWRRPA